MLCTRSLLIVKAHRYPVGIFSDATVTVLHRVAEREYEDSEVFVVDAEHILDMEKNFFATAAGRDLVFISNQIRHFNIDWIFISKDITS